MFLKNKDLSIWLHKISKGCNWLFSRTYGMGAEHWETDLFYVIQETQMQKNY